MPRTASPHRTLRQVFAHNVRLSRVHVGMSQERLADAVTLDRTFIGSVERGERNISIDNVERISAALGFAAHELVDPGFAERYGLDESVTRAPRTARLYPAQSRPRKTP